MSGINRNRNYLTVECYRDIVFVLNNEVPRNLLFVGFSGRKFIHKFSEALNVRSN